MLSPWPPPKKEVPYALASVASYAPASALKKEVVTYALASAPKKEEETPPTKEVPCSRPLAATKEGGVVYALASCRRWRP